MAYAIILIMATVALATLIHELWFEVRSGSWPRTSGTIEGVLEHGHSDDGLQSYCCSYIFRVEGVRQAGLFTVSEKINRLSQMQNTLIGQPVTVCYDPDDCTRCRVDESHVQGYRISNL